MTIRLGIAEDYPSMIDIYKSYFVETGNIEIIWVSEDGRDTIKKLEKQDIDILILDILMPQANGLEILRWLNNSKLDHKPKVVVCSVVSNEIIIKKAIEYGANYFFVKPFDFTILTEKINELM